MIKNHDHVFPYNLGPSIAYKFNIFPQLLMEHQFEFLFLQTHLTHYNITLENKCEEIMMIINKILVDDSLASISVDP